MIYRIVAIYRFHTDLAGLRRLIARLEEEVRHARQNPPDQGGLLPCSGCERPGSAVCSGVVGLMPMFP